MRELDQLSRSFGIDGMGCRLTIGMLLALFVAVPAVTSRAEAPLAATVSTLVTGDETSGIFTYRYRVANAPTSTAPIHMIDIEVTRSSVDATLSGDGLVNGPLYMRTLSADAFQRVPMVPVGITGPEGWIFGLGFDTDTPPRGFAGWGTTDEPLRITPGQALDGFQLASRGLPGIRLVKLQPVVDIPKNVGQEWEDLNAFFETVIVRTVVVGPKAPPLTFVPLEFLNSLIALLHQSRDHSWITVDGVHQSLLAKLRTAKRKLEEGDTATARNILTAFLHEVTATSCPQFTCPGNKLLTSEAYALLFFNGEYLASRLTN